MHTMRNVPILIHICIGAFVEASENISRALAFATGQSEICIAKPMEALAVQMENALFERLEE